ncbi:MAG: hypothetical protein Q8L47_03895 [bacterium]|nr:hypothetical protein [bacterium]
MLVLYTKTGERQLTLFIERSKILGVITQSKTLAIQIFTNTTTGDIPCGYGVHFNPPSYFVFKNKAAMAKGGECDQIKNGSNLNLYNLSRDEQIGEKLSLSRGVNFSGSFPQTILFIPPDPTVKLSSSIAGVQIITIATIDTPSVQTKIKINDFGQISFDN